MDIRSIVRKALGVPESRSHNAQSRPVPKRRSELDIFFTDNFHAKAEEWDLTEAHARHVFYEGDTVKENMKVATVNGEEIGIYVFRDRETNQPVITSIWKRTGRRERRT